MPRGNHVLPALLLLVAGVTLGAYLLWRFPYDGLYGQDAYAYYGQALAWWRELTGAPPDPNALYTSQGIRWPIGYHLHVMLGILAGTGAWGGWAITLLMAAACPVLVYLITQHLWPGAEPRVGMVAGLVAGAALLFTGTYVRFGLSLMADVPALFWGLLGLLIALKGKWLPAGLALGLAVLTRYGSLLFFAPLAVYLALDRGRAAPFPRPLNALPLFTAGFAITLLPQALYLLTHQAGAGYSAFLSDWNPANIFATTATSSDGTQHYPYSMLFFYLVLPLLSAPAGFFSFLLLPTFALGLWALGRSRRWAALGFLVAWWLLPALLLSGTPYQAHRFVILYLPALAIPAGIGASVALQALLRSVKSRPSYLSMLRVGAAGLLLAALAAGAYLGLRSVLDWMGVHEAAKVEERAALRLLRGAANEAEPRIVAFGLTAALHHYTGWRAADIYNYDEESMSAFISAAPQAFVVAPEEAVRTQWANTAVARRWEWLRATYDLTLLGNAGQYNVYEVGGATIQRVRGGR